MARVTKKLDAGSFQLKDQVVSINRVTKVVKGGKNMSFAALVVVRGGMVLAVATAARLALAAGAELSPPVVVGLQGARAAETGP